MADNKKHHFVPRTYLKNFSGDKKSINIYNISSDRVFMAGKLKTQCYRDYLYGKDGKIEKALSLTEGAGAAAIRSTLISATPPPRESGPYYQLLMFVIFQHHRTTRAAESLKEMSKNFANAVLSADPRVDKELLDKFTISVKDPASLAVSVASRSVHLGLDLKCKLLIAKPGSEFITSDNPAIFYSQLLEKSWLVKGLGLALTGLQVFLPISPNFLLYYYDEAAYKSGQRRSDAIQITEQRDMDSLNALQLAAADENVYFSNPANAMLNRISYARKFRLEELNELRSYPGNRKDGLMSELLVSSKNWPRTNLELSFVRTLPAGFASLTSAESAGTVYPNLIRDPYLVELDHQYQDQLNKGYKGGFIDFLQETKPAEGVAKG